MKRQHPPKKKKAKASTSRHSILDKVTDELFEDVGLKVALYGRSGTGKTTFWSTFPRPILAVVCSGGKRSGELRSIADRTNIKRFPLESCDEIPELCEALEEENKYRTVVLDHASYLQDIRIKEILGLSDVPISKYKVAKKGETWGIASQQEWGQCAINMKEYLRGFLDLSCNVVIVAQEREFNNDENSELLMPYVGAALSPSVTGWLNPAADFIFQTFKRNKVITKQAKVAKKKVTRKVTTDEVEYCLRTGPDSTYTTKFRLPKGQWLPDVVVDPNYEHVLDIISGNSRK